MVYSTFFGLSTFLAPILINLFGNRWTMVIAGVSQSLGALLTRFTMDHSLNLVILSMGALQALGTLTILPTYNIAIRFLSLLKHFSLVMESMLIYYRLYSGHKGTAIGVTDSGFGLGVVVLIPFQLAIANPNNISPISVDGSDDQYFTDKEVLDRIPTLVYSLAGFYTFVFFIGFILSFLAPDSNHEDQQKAS